jgi:hypothetical protein
MHSCIHASCLTLFDGSSEARRGIHVYFIYLFYFGYVEIARGARSARKTDP